MNRLTYIIILDKCFYDAHAPPKELEDYTVLVTQEGTTFVVTNTYDEGTPENPEQPENPDQPGNPTLPQTGQLWWPVPVLVAGGLLLIVIGVLRRRGNTHEK